MSGDYYHKRSPPADAADDERHHSTSKRDGRNRSRSRTPSRRHHHHRSPDASRSRGRRRGQRSRSRSRDRERGARRHRERDRDSRRRRDTHSRSRSRSRGRRSGSRTHSNQQRGHNASHHSVGAASAGDARRYDMSLDNLPLPKQQQQQQQPPPRDSIGAYYDLDTEEPIDKERIHREIEEKLRETLAKEGKVYPPPKVEASHPVFANDGSFLEIFKKMQEAQQQHPAALSGTKTPAMAMPLAVPPPANGMLPTTSVAATSTATAGTPVAVAKSGPPPPLVGRRRGGKILKTGLVAKQKMPNDTAADPKDFWSLYLAEVNKYKSHACETETGNRPLVK